MKSVIGRKLYNTETADLIADNEFRDGTNKFNHGRASYLYRTKKGQFFAHYATCWQGEQDEIVPLTIKEAQDFFEDLGGDPDTWPDAFGPLEEA